MEEQVQNTGGGTPKFVMPTVIAALIVLAVIGYYFYSSGNNSTTTPAAMESTESQTGSAMEATTGSYKNGTYNVKGEYVSPGGPREVGVTLTLADGVITDVSAEVLATDATSKRFQEEFAGGFKSMVVGKNLDEVMLTKVSGSSLTPKGFNDAVEKIKVEAGS